MTSSPPPLPTLLRMARFLWRVLVAFRANKGMLLASAIAYNTLLSIVPFFGVILIILSHFMDPAQLLTIARAQIDLLAPGQSEALASELVGLLQGRALLGTVGVLVALFFSSLAFRVLEDAMGTIFGKEQERERSFWVSWAIPYAYMLIAGIALVALTILTSVLDGLAGRTVSFMGWSWTSSYNPGLVMELTGFGLLVALFSSIYRVVPTAHVKRRRAVVGGFVAALLWEATRWVLVWYFASVSMVSLVYGSLTSVVIVLFSMEVAAIILLLGAQVIAELEGGRGPWMRKGLIGLDNALKEHHLAAEPPSPAEKTQ